MPSGYGCTFGRLLRTVPDPCLRPTVAPRHNPRRAPGWRERWSCYTINADPSRTPTPPAAGPWRRGPPAHGMLKARLKRCARVPAAMHLGPRRPFPCPSPPPARRGRICRSARDLQASSAPGGQGGADFAAGLRGNRQHLEQMAEDHIEHTGQEDRRRQRENPRQDDVAHGRPLQP
jgi:hypothetical protein